MRLAGEIDWESFSFQFGFRQNRNFLPLKQVLPPGNATEGSMKKTEASTILNQSAAILPSKKASSRELAEYTQFVCSKPFQKNGRKDRMLSKPFFWSCQSLRNQA